MTQPPHALRRTLVAIHGFTGRPESWSPVLNRIPSASCAVKVPGHGLPAHPDSGFAGAIRTVRDQLPRSVIEQGYDLAGYSLGGRLALGLAVRHPTEVHHLVLIGTHPGLNRDEDRARRIADDEALAQRLETDGLEAFIAHWRTLPLFASQANLPIDLRAWQDALRNTNTAPDLANALRQMTLGRMPCYLKDLPHLPMPVLIMAGALDFKFRAIAETMVKHMATSRLVVIPDAGHNLPLERPRALATAIRAFVGPRSQN